MILKRSELLYNSTNADAATIIFPGQVVQELASYLQMTALQSKASFPSEVAAFRDVLEQVELYHLHQASRELNESGADCSQWDSISFGNPRVVN